MQPWQVDWCWRCGKVFSGPSHARQLAGHEGQCHVPSVPPPRIPCRKGRGRQFEWRFPSGRRKQAHHAREYRHMHEKLCSGDERGSRTCPFCNKVCPEGTSDETVLRHRDSCSSRPREAASSHSTWKCPKCSCRFSPTQQVHHEATSRIRPGEQILPVM